VSREVPSLWVQNTLLRKTFDRKMRECWRNLARPVTLFDEHSLAILARERNARIL
jgi:hypothetical protein